MPKKYIMRFMPDHQVIRNHKTLNRVFGTLLHDPNLLHLNRRSVSGAFFAGLFLAFMPLPIQMILAVGLSILLRINMPITFGLVWITNPVTIPPMFYFAYRLGAWLLGVDVEISEIELSFSWLKENMSIIGYPLLFGSLVCGWVAGVSGFVIVRVLWRLHVIRRWQERKARRIAA